MFLEFLLGDVAPGDIDILSAYIYMPEEVLVHPGVIRLVGVGIYWPVLIEIECDHPGEIKVFLFVQSDEFFVNVYGSVSSSQAEYSVLFFCVLLSYYLRYSRSNCHRRTCIVTKYLYWYTFEVQGIPYIFVIF